MVFIPGDSLFNQPAYLYHIFTEALDAGKETVFCDISKPFEWYGMKNLFTNLKLLVFQETSSVGFKATSQRVRRVVLPGGFSEWVYIKAEVPQGSILVPLLLYINDIL